MKTGYNYPLPGVNFASFLREMRNMIVRTVRDTLGLVEVQHRNLSQNVSHTQNSTTVHASSCKSRATFLASAGGNRCGATVDKKFVRPKRVRRGRKPKKESRGYLLHRRSLVEPRRPSERSE